MNVTNLRGQDLTVLENTIAMYASCFTSPHVSFENSYTYLPEFNKCLQQFINLQHENYPFYNFEKHHYPHLNLTQTFELFLYLAYLKQFETIKETYLLIDEIEELPIFQVKDFTYNNNPFYTTMEEILTASSDLLDRKIKYSDFLSLIEQHKDSLFPKISEHNEEGQDNYQTDSQQDNSTILTSQHDFDHILLSDTCIVYLKEKIYLNLLLDFIEHPENYNNAPYLFIDFLGAFSFNTEDTFSFSHLKEVFMRFEDKHFTVLKSLKNHPLYNLFIDILFIDKTCIFNEKELKDEYLYYFDFRAFNLFLKRGTILDDFFNCGATNNQSMKEFLESIVENNKYTPDIERLHNLMIIYEKNKIESKLKPKNITCIINKI